MNFPTDSMELEQDLRDLRTDHVHKMMDLAYREGYKDALMQRSDGRIWLWARLVCIPLAIAVVVAMAVTACL